MIMMHSLTCIVDTLLSDTDDTHPFHLKTGDMLFAGKMRDLSPPPHHCGLVHIIMISTRTNFTNCLGTWLTLDVSIKRRYPQHFCEFHDYIRLNSSQVHKTQKRQCNVRVCFHSVEALVYYFLTWAWLDCTFWYIK